MWSSSISLKELGWLSCLGGFCCSCGLFFDTTKGEGCPGTLIGESADAPGRLAYLFDYLEVVLRQPNAFACREFDARPAVAGLDDEKLGSCLERLGKSWLVAVAIALPRHGLLGRQHAVLLSELAGAGDGEQQESAGGAEGRCQR